MDLTPGCTPEAASDLLVGATMNGADVRISSGSNDVRDLPARSRIKPLIAGILGVEQVREGPAHPRTAADD
ncbi:MAG: hypothetical protein KDJ71_08685 [Nitrobacter sp.]|nr:hypothetical protein [Nitrobacter sp.]